MDEFLERISKLSPKRLALLAMELQSKVEALERARAEPVAIIGLACRFPGGSNSPEAYWRMLQNGVDAVTEVDPSRWDVNAYFDPDPDAPGKIASKWGGFIDDVDKFDPHFFGISPREAVSMDPQQRLMLEVGWEALEHAGYAPDKLMGTRTGVFVGICNSDYAQMLMSGDPENIDAYVSTGNAHSVASGRISYLLGLQGPSLSVDTACSSSLVAVHLAVQSLRNGECRLALAGGVNVILAPDVTVTLSKAKMMSSNGRCKAFDADADGFVRSEGVGAVALKRLSDAVADGDNILAVIRGSAINQDGRSNGLTAPNGPSQESVIKEALANAGVQPFEVSYIETHGTGTSLGDPIEAQALGAVLTRGRPEANKLAIGSVKTNIGHAEAAAGIAGLIKVVLALQHKEIPPHLHLHQRSPFIPWDDIPVSIPTERASWQPVNDRWIAGVSSFGFSGTNAHVIVEAAPQREATAADVERPLHILTLSAKTEAALKELASRFSSHSLEPLADVCHTANAGRSHFAHRLAVIAGDSTGLREKLNAFIAGQEVDDVISGRMQGTRAPEIAFLFTGQGSQYLNMGRRLYETQPVFRKTLDRCDELLRPHLNQSLISILYSQPDSSLLDQTAYTQPALFAVEYALAELWQSWGVKPSAVMGHSVGEYVAACVAGVFSLEDGLKLIAERGRLMQSLPPDGEMAAVFASAAKVAEAVAPFADKVSIAALNGPDNVTISGERSAVAAVLEKLQASKIKSRRLAVSIASHSPLMAPILDAFEKVAASVAYSPPQIEFVSGVTGRLVSGHEIAGPGYWRRHMREAVQFAACVETLHQRGYKVFLEIGATPNLIGMGKRCLPDGAGLWLPSLRPNFDDWSQLLTSLATLYANGADVNWAGFDKDYARSKVTLPTYPFQRERYWLDSTGQRRRAEAVVSRPDLHPLLGRRLRSPVLSEHVFESQVNAQWPPYLDHHRLYGMSVLPSPAYIEMALSAAKEIFGEGARAVENLTIHEALLLPEASQGARTVQLILTPDGENKATFKAFSFAETGETWKQHATGVIQLAPPETSAATFSVDEVRARCPDEISGDDYYAKVRGLGLEFGADFRGIAQLWRRDGEALGRIRLPDSLAAEAARYAIHPAFLDACFHLLGAPLPDDGTDTAYLLIGIERFRLYASPGAQLWNHTLLKNMDAGKETFVGDIRLYDDEGRLVAEATGLQLKRAGREALMRATQGQRFGDWLYEVQWQLKPRASEATLLAPGQVAAQAAPRMAQLSTQHKLSAYYDAVLPALDSLSATYVAQAFRELGWKPVVGRRVSVESLARELGVVQQHHRLFGRLLEMLGEEGVLRAVGGEWEVIGELKEAAAPDVKTLAAQHPAHETEFTLTARCGSQLANVLRGAADPLQLLFPNGSFEATEKLYQDSPFARAYNTLIQEAVAAALARLPEGRTVRILEIGAGTGATTSYLLDSLPRGQAEYTFTDVSPTFLARAEKKFSGRDFMRYQLLDIEADPAAQGFASQSYDIVLAANVLHATSDLRRTLTHVRQVLAPGGLLILLEGTARQRWVDLTFGLTEGWWKFSDGDLRPSYPLLSKAKWQSLLAELDFSDAVAIPDDESVGQVVLLARKPVAASTESGTWLIVADEGGVGNKLAELLNARGEQAVLASADERLDLSAPYRGVVHLSSLDSADADCGNVLTLTQSLIRAGGSTRLWLATRNAQPTEAASSVTPGQATVWGLGRVIALEHPELWGGVVDLASNSSAADDAASLLAEILNPDGEDQIAWREGKRYAPRLIRNGNLKGRATQWRPDGAYLITGGLGGLGLKLARWMAEQGARHIVLLGRTGLPERSQWPTLTEKDDAYRKAKAIQEIEATGATVTVVSADVSDRARMTQVFEQFGQTLPPLRGVVHAAAALSSWLVKDMQPEALQAMLRPKVAGTWILHELTKELELDFFALFSSTTALWGSRQLAHYAAANQFLDSFAHYRRSLGLSAISLNWGTWEEMRAASAEERQEVAQFGLNTMPSAQALEVLGGFLGADLPQVVVASVDWSLLKPAYEARRQRPFLELVDAKRKAKEEKKQATPAQPKLLQELEKARPDERRNVVLNHVRSEAARILRLDASRPIDVNQGLFEMGMDSLMSVELKSRLEAGVGQSLPSTLTFNYPTIADLTGYLTTEVLNLESAEPAAEVESPKVAEPPIATPSDTDEMSEDELADLLAAKLARIK
jgi:acyl transferase domain-containing protein/protein-L-isoaspartate O-methyltransferase